MEKILLPCPFCGGKASLNTTRYAKDSDIARLNKRTVFYGVNCISCGTDSTGLVGSRSQAEAMKKWNKRDTMVAHRGGNE